MTTESETEQEHTPVQKVKQLRQDGDGIIQRVRALAPTAETTLAMRKFQEGVMWLGMELKRMGEANPYLGSKDPSTGDVIEPTADNLKL